MTDYRFRCLGPYYFPACRDAEGRRTLNCLAARDEVFAQAEADAEDIGIRDIYSAVGLYIFGLSPSGSPRTWPYYVGRASRQPLYRRLFQQTDKPAKYSAILGEYERARPFVYLFPLVTGAGRQVKAASGTGTVVFKTIADAEYQLIGQALHVNPDLYNVQDARSQRRFVIDGTPRADARETRSAQSFRSMMGFDLKKRAPARLSEATLAAVQGEAEAEEALSHQDPAELVPEAPLPSDQAAE